MEKVSDYRMRAQEFRALAAAAKSDEHREMLLGMAATWEALANTRAEDLARQMPRRRDRQD